MDNNWAAEHLQTIRILMERSALYRRALAPISTFVGVVGIVAAVAAWGLKVPSSGAFSIYWMAIGLIAVTGALLLVRRQAVKQGENFWSPPTRRVVKAMFPALLVGFVVGSLFAAALWPGVKDNDTGGALLLVTSWMLLYGLALNSAGFFMTRGIRLFGWGFIIGAFVLLGYLLFLAPLCCDLSPHFMMGILFGASHLAYGIYLYFTERKNEA